jgi:hypothetical protein
MGGLVKPDPASGVDGGVAIRPPGPLAQALESPLPGWRAGPQKRLLTIYICIENKGFPKTVTTEIFSRQLVDNFPRARYNRPFALTEKAQEPGPVLSAALPGPGRQRT